MAISADIYSVIENPLMAARTSIRIGGEAIAEVQLHSTEAVEYAPGLLARIGGQIRVIGAGSNILAADGKLPFTLVHFERHGEPRVLKESDSSVLVSVDAGMRLPALLAWTARHGFSGLEGLAGIPGNLGGALAMNAGSFGVDTWRFVQKVELFSPSLGLVERDASEFDFSYRRCSLRGHEGWYIFTKLTVALTKGISEEIRGRVKEFFLKKQSTQPVAAKSAGCVFKNPAPDAPAGKLIDEAGLKGHRVGDVYFSTLHANFLVNEGRGTFAQAMELIALAKERVRERTGHELELEVQVWR